MKIDKLTSLLYITKNSQGPVTVGEPLGVYYELYITKNSQGPVTFSANTFYRCKLYITKNSQGPVTKTDMTSSEY